MKSLIPINGNVIPTDLREVAEYVSNKTGEAIKEGTEKPTASNGRSMKELNGAAEMTATFKNIGESAQEGSGMSGGVKTLILNAKATSILQTLDVATQNTSELPTIEKQPILQIADLEENE